MERVYIAQSVAAKFEALVKAHAATYTAGNGLDAGANQGLGGSLSAEGGH